MRADTRALAELAVIFARRAPTVRGSVAVADAEWLCRYGRRVAREAEADCNGDRHRGYCVRLDWGPQGPSNNLGGGWGV